MWFGSRISNPVTFHRPFLLLSSSFRFNFSTTSLSLSQDYPSLHEDCSDFLPWLQQKAGHEISKFLSIGTSIHGRSLFASRSVQAGDCILKVPYIAQITPDNIHPNIRVFLSDDVGNVARLALVILAEQKMGQDSEWAPYINSLPRIGELHSTIFWSDDELKMVQQSLVHQETLNHKAFIEKEFLKVRLALEHFPYKFEDATLESFMHAYALVGSRAWGTSKGLSMIPFADFLNHDGVSEMVLLSDEDKGISEAIADRDYASEDQVFISYGKFSNATLLLDFGFTLPYNKYDQLQIWMGIPQYDPLHTMKVELLHQHSMPTISSIDASRSSFIIKEVRSAKGKGKGIPQSLRAFARVLSATSKQELEDLAREAAQSDGRLARCPLKDRDNEIKAHRLLLSEITHMIQEYDAAIKSLLYMNSHTKNSPLSLRRQMARNLLTGELRVLKSASAWLINYCAS